MDRIQSLRVTMDDPDLRCSSREVKEDHCKTISSVDVDSPSPNTTNKDHHHHQKLPQYFCLANVNIAEPVDEGFVDKCHQRVPHKFSLNNVTEVKNDTMNSKKRQNSIDLENLTKRIKFDQHQN